MAYKEFKPSKKLEPIVDAYWSYSNLEKVENEKILPDGSMDIIFNFGTSTSSILTNSIGISGMMMLLCILQLLITQLQLPMMSSMI